MERILMSKQLKAIAIFAGMIALPILADNVLNRRPDIRLFRSFEWPWQLTLVLILVIAAVAVFAVYDMIWGPTGILKKFEDDIGQIQGWVKLAERELLGILRAWDQTGRQNIWKERAEWVALEQVPAYRLVDPDREPLSHRAFELAKADMVSRGTAMGNATFTAILLREVYGGNYGRPKIKIEAELAADKTPFVAPGLKQLFGYGVEEKTVDGKTEKKLKWDPPHDSVKLSMAMREGGFPNQLFLVDKDKTLKGWEAVWKLTQQAPHPEWKEPEKKPPSKLSRYKLYWEYRRTCWADAVTPK
jgi:hypothetical protein